MSRNDESMRDNTADVTTGNTGREVGEGVGGVGGAVAGAAIGSVVGPIGTVIGGIAGAVGGWWAGKGIVDAAEGYNGTEDTYRTHFNTMPRGSGARFQSYDQARPAYQLGYLASQNPDYAGRTFDQIEPDMQRGWTGDIEKQYGSWNDARGYAREAYDRGCEQMGNGTRNDMQDSMKGDRTMTRSEEELVIGKRQVQAGEVDLKKTVETEHVRKTVPLMHEEIEVERHAVDANASDRNVEIGEEDIRVPLSAEEAVVNKRVVAKEEVVVKKHAVDETRNVEADIRKERIDIDREGRGKDTSDKDRNSERPSGGR